MGYENIGLIHAVQMLLCCLFFKKISREIRQIEVKFAKSIFPSYADAFTIQNTVPLLNLKKSTILK